MSNANTETFKITRKTVWKCLPCDGEAHEPEAGGNVDHCRVCAPMWAEIPVPEVFPTLDAWRDWLRSCDATDRKHAPSRAGEGGRSHRRGQARCGVGRLRLVIHLLIALAPTIAGAVGWYLAGFACSGV